MTGATSSGTPTCSTSMISGCRAADNCGPTGARSRRDGGAAADAAPADRRVSGRRDQLARKPDRSGAIGLRTVQRLVQVVVQLVDIAAANLERGREQLVLQREILGQHLV